MFSKAIPSPRKHQAGTEVLPLASIFLLGADYADEKHDWCLMNTEGKILRPWPQASVRHQCSRPGVSRLKRSVRSVSHLRAAQQREVKLG